MTLEQFSYPLTPPVLNWLVNGKISVSFSRAIRLWVILRELYNQEVETGWDAPLRHLDIRRLLHYSQSHPESDENARSCEDEGCICHWTVESWLNAEQKQMLISYLGKDKPEGLLNVKPFETVPKTLRDDVLLLYKAGWLKKAGRSFQRQHPDHWPKFSDDQASVDRELGELTTQDRWHLIKALESISVVDPQLDVASSLLLDQLSNRDLEQRIFFHFDYILSEEKQDLVNDLQHQLRDLWCGHEGGVIQFDYWYKPDKKVESTVHPVCLHYARRAKYLTAYGKDPEGSLEWHNYRLDRISSKRLKVLDWEDPRVPDELIQLYSKGELPNSEDVEQAMEEAWGFNFYLPKQLMILRFSREFADWYVRDTERHPTFESIEYEELEDLIWAEIPDEGQQQQILQILDQRPREDAYFKAWVRVGDINLIMRLRDWRPQGEVIAPICLRERMRREALQELAHYQN